MKYLNCQLRRLGTAALPGEGACPHAPTMKRGFTILELLVATLLLGILATILTMIFNQSSISWRIGLSQVSNMNDIRDNMAELHEESDNAFVYNGEIHRILGLWKQDGTLRNRACDATKGAVAEMENSEKANLLRTKNQLNLNQPRLDEIAPISLNQANNQTKYVNYTVNVMSGGPKNDVEDWQAIWSFPDDPNEW
jgi:prepilin-type N-terminal cleavage/methylation domain-containing protein